MSDKKKIANDQAIQGRAMYKKLRKMSSGGIYVYIDEKKEGDVGWSLKLQMKFASEEERNTFYSYFYIPNSMTELLIDVADGKLTMESKRKIPTDPQFFSARIKEILKLSLIPKELHEGIIASSDELLEKMKGCIISDPLLVKTISRLAAEMVEKNVDKLTNDMIDKFIELNFDRSL